MISRTLILHACAVQEHFVSMVMIPHVFIAVRILYLVAMSVHVLILYARENSDCLRGTVGYFESGEPSSCFVLGGNTTLPKTGTFDGSEQLGPAKTHAALNRHICHLPCSIRMRRNT